MSPEGPELATRIQRALQHRLWRLKRAYRASAGAYRLLQHCRRSGVDELLWLVETVGEDYGHFRSLREQLPVMRDGSPVPWYTYPAIEYLQQFDFSDWDVFEYGGGNSSKFWSARCRSLVTVESDPAWYERLVQAAAPNQTILLESDPGRYAAAIARDGRRYKLIVVDGEHRPACAEQSVERLDPAGAIVFDNADWFPRACAFLRERGLLQVDFKGLGPINRYASTTSLFLSRQADFRTAAGRQPLPGIASLRQVVE